MSGDGWVGRRTIAYVVNGERFTTKKAAIAAGHSPESLTAIPAKRWNAALWVPDPATGRNKLHWLPNSFKTEREARAALRAVVRTVDDGTYTKPTKMTLTAFLDEQWFPSIAASLRPTTIAMYRSYADTHIKPRLGGTLLRGLAPAQLNKVYAELLENGRKDGRGALSPRAVRLVHVVLHRCLQDAVKWGLIPRNPAALATPPRGTSTERDPLTPAHVSAFLRHVERDRLAALWRLLAATGLRRGEVLGLRWDDIDLERAVLTVSQTVVIVEHKPVIAPGRAKTKSSRRTLALDPQTVTDLRSHRARQAQERLALGEAWVDSGLVFTRPDGTVIDPTWLTRTFDRYRKAADLPASTLHGLRHAYATLLLQSGVPLRTVSARLGHASPTVTMSVYSHVLPGDDQDAALVGARLLETS